VVGVELTSIGQIEAKSPEDVTIVQEDVESHHYRKLVIADGKAVGAILLGHPLDAPVVTAIIKDGVDIAPYLEALQAGQWDQLHRLSGQ
jgi:nitrite reductase (NADH) large subunit